MGIQSQIVYAFSYETSSIPLCVIPALDDPPLAMRGVQTVMMSQRGYQHGRVQLPIAVVRSFLNIDVYLKFAGTVHFWSIPTGHWYITLGW